jgi:hypothetical protein
MLLTHLMNTKNTMTAGIMKKILFSLLSKVNSKSGVIVSSSNKTIYQCEEFHELIDLERDRVHRDDQQFSLVLIDVYNHSNGIIDSDKLVHKISKRVRRIDRIGWYDDAHLGVLLPNTTQAGARNFANDICKAQDGLNSAIAFETFSYPDKRLSGADKYGITGQRI